MGLHRAAAEGFERGAAAYERGRPSYPGEAVAWMIGQLQIGTGSTVVDLGAGTGKFTRLLRPSGARLIAIEPVAAMRAELERAVPEVQVIDGTAESMPLADHSVDCLVAAQAFHWFATPAAVREIHRVLGESGGLGLIWNRRDLRDPLQAALNAIVRDHRGEAPAHERNRWREALEGNPLFRPIGEQQFPFEQAADQDGVVDRVLSTSFIAAMDDPMREQVAKQVRGLVRPGDMVALRYLTDVFLFRSR
jgi:SAM-dependent methyltransferase